MKNFVKIFGIIALIAVMVSVTGCVTNSTIGGTADSHGLFSSAKVVADGEEIASYSVILGLFTSGYANYATAVRAAESSGRQITSTTTWLVILRKTTAFAK